MRTCSRAPGHESLWLRRSSTGYLTHGDDEGVIPSVSEGPYVVGGPASPRPGPSLPLGMTRPLIVLIALFVVAFLLAITFGATPVSLRAAIGGDVTARAILFGIRIPRVVTGALVGAILAVAGLTFQTLLRNPLADPFILGVSGGAAAGAAMATAFGWA